jgi:hypothetical protein
MRRLAFTIILAIALALIFSAVSAALFSSPRPKARTTALRILLAVLWPLAILSSAGRSLLFHNFNQENNNAR